MYGVGGKIRWRANYVARSQRCLCHQGVTELMGHRLTKSHHFLVGADPSH